jgi:hypothetical protein
MFLFETPINFKKIKIKSLFSDVTNIKKLFADAQPLSKRYHNMKYEHISSYCTYIPYNTAVVSILAYT